MNSNRGFFAELLHRRVPQIVGMYIAGTWMAIEICDWLIERLELPQQLALYLFVLLIGLLPSAILLTWGHGAPGKDRWSTLEKFFLPLNGVAVAALLIFGIQPSRTEAAIEERVLLDETGQPRTFQVAREGHYVRAVGFFWPNRTGEADYDWLSYALPWLISKDLDRSPAIDYESPYDLPIRDRYARAGHPSAVGEPLSLQLDIAQRRLIQYVVAGRLDREGDQLVLSASIYDTDGVRVAELSYSDPDWLNAVDAMATAIEAEISKVDPAQIGTALAIREHVSGSPEALAEMIRGLNALFLENDYAAALTGLRRAAEIDPEFAYAHAAAASVERLMGDNVAAMASIDRAMALDHRLDTATRLLLKANAYAMQGQFDTAVKVLEMWTEVQPRSAEAHELLGRNYTVLGDLGGAERAFRRAYELNPEAHDALKQLADVERMRGNPDRATDYINRYMEVRPEDPSALRKLAAVHRQTGDFEAARDALERASFLEADDFQARLQLAQLSLREGAFEAARNQIDQLSGRELSPEQEIELRLSEIKLLIAQGRIDAALEVAERYRALAKSVYPPIVEIFTVGGLIAGLHTELGNIDAALAAIDDMVRDIQPPMDRFKLFSQLQVFEAARMVDEYLATLEEARAFAKTFKFPFLEPFMTVAEGNALLFDGEYDSAEKKIRSGMEMLGRSLVGLDPDVAEFPVHNLARALRLDGRLEAAEHELTQQLTRSPFDAQSRLELARVYLAGGRPAAASEMVAVALKQWSDADVGFVRKQRAMELKQQIDLAL